MDRESWITDHMEEIRESRYPNTNYDDLPKAVQEEIFTEAEADWISIINSCPEPDLNISADAMHRAERLKSSILPTPVQSTSAPVCAYCGKEADAAMLVMGDSMAHDKCVVRELNKLLDPDYDGKGEPEQIVQFTAKTAEDVRGQVAKLLSFGMLPEGKQEGDEPDLFVRDGYYFITEKLRYKIADSILSLMEKGKK